MSRKNSNSFVGFLCLLAVVIAATCVILNLLGVSWWLLEVIQNLALLFAVICGSWNYVKSCSKGMQVVYYISLGVILVVWLLGWFHIIK